MNLEIIKTQKAKLPETYQHAKQSLATCERIDECKDWADKASALASYAKQADDGELENFAKRIRIRALRRCGELLKAIEAKPGQRTDLGTVATTGKKKAARDAGLSERQQKTATNIASVPPNEFNSIVDGGTPPTVTELSELGKTKKVFTKGQINQVMVRRKLIYILDVLDEFDFLQFCDELGNLDDEIGERAMEHSGILEEIGKCILTKI